LLIYLRGRLLCSGLLIRLRCSLLICRRSSLWSLLICLWGSLRRRRLIGWLLRTGYCQATQQKTGKECGANTSWKRESHGIDPPCGLVRHFDRRQNKYC
jgi:hypothetical protein